MSESSPLEASAGSETVGIYEDKRLQHPVLYKPFVYMANNLVLQLLGGARQRRRLQRVVGDVQYLEQVRGLRAVRRPLVSVWGWPSEGCQSMS